jgi:hypothetical protein
MGQVPTFKNLPIVLLGSGRLATHLAHYLTLLQIPFTRWSRKGDPLGVDLKALRLKPTRLLFAVSDAALSQFFLQTWPTDSHLIHFSGVLHDPRAIGLHPLMSFPADQLYDVATYKNIPFVGTSDAPALKHVLPELPNPYFEIHAEQKPLYHALCVFTGNFTTLLWQRGAEEFSKHLGLPEHVLIPYMQQVFANTANHLNSSLTGPLARGDRSTILSNLNALEGSTLQDIYRAFVTDFQTHRNSEVSL